MTAEEKDKTMCYVGVKSCGCMVAATVDDGVNPKQIRKDVSEFMKAGCTIQRYPVWYVREHLMRCPHRAKPA